MHADIRGGSSYAMPSSPAACWCCCSSNLYLETLL